MARKKIQVKSKRTTQKKSLEPTIKEIKEILQLPNTKEGDEKLEKMLSTFDDSFSQREKLFILFFTKNHKMIAKFMGNMI